MTTDQTKLIARALADCDPALVSAAPDLLAALQAIEMALLLPGVSAAEILDENSPIRGGMRDAIAKAKGDLVGMWDAIPESEKQVLTKAFSQGFSEQARCQS